MKDDFRQFRDRMLADPKTRDAYDSRKPLFEFAVQLAELRRRRGLSQAALARLVGVKQSEVARIESADASPTLNTMARLLAAAEADIDIRFRDDAGKIVRLPVLLKGADQTPRAKRGSRLRARSISETRATHATG